MAVDVGSAKGYLDLDISGFLNGLKTAQTEADTKTKNIATKIGGNLSGIGKSLSSAGTTLTKNVTVPLLGIGAAGLKVATDFEKGMSQVKAISGATGKDFDALKNKAIELGADTAFSAGEVASAMTEMAKAGWGSQQIIDGMSGVLAAAAASGEGLATVSTIVADSITGFGLAASDSTKIADLLTQAANSGTIGITDLGESFKYIAPVAGAMGLSVEDVTTAISAMSMAGIKGSQAGTALRTMLTRLVKPTDDVASTMEALGISVVNQDGSMKSLDEIVSNLRNSFDGLTDSERAKNAAILAGQEGMSGLLSLLNLTEEEYNAIAKSMDNAGGVAEETAAIMQDNLQSKVEQLGGALESLAIKLADYVLPYVQQFVVWLTSLVDKFTVLDPQTQKTILKFAGLAAIAGPLVLALGKIVTTTGSMFTTFGKIPGAITKMKAGFTALGTNVKNVGEGFKLAKAGYAGLATQSGSFGAKIGASLAGATGPMIAIVAVVGLIIAAFVSLWKNNEEFRKNVTAIWNQIKETFKNFTQGIVDRLNSLGFNFKSITDVIKAVWKGFCNFLAPIFEGVFKQVANIFKLITNQVLNVLDFFIAVFKGDWKGAWESIKNTFKNAWNFIKNTFQNVLNTMKKILNTILSWFGTNWTNCWNSIKKTFTNVWNSIKTTASNVWNSIKTTASNVWDSIKNAISNHINSAKTTVSNVVNSIKSTISTGFNSAKSTVSSIFDSIKSKINSTMEGAKSIVTNAVSKLKSAFNFSWSLPKLKLPHISVSGGEAPYGIGGMGSLPSFSIEWYKKAMSGGMILNSPTIFGYNPLTDKFMGAGEAGSETIVGTESLMKMISSAVANTIKPFIAITYQLARTSAELGYVTHNGFVAQRQMQNKFSEFVSSGAKGDTFNFYSPKAIDEIEAAKQMKKAKRELAEGF